MISDFLEDEFMDPLATHSPHSPSGGKERERMRRVHWKVCKGRGDKGTKSPLFIAITMTVPIVIRRLGLRSTMKKIVRLCHSTKQKELFLIGVPFSGGQVKY